MSRKPPITPAALFSKLSSFQFVVLLQGRSGIRHLLSSINLLPIPPADPCPRRAERSAATA